MPFEDSVESLDSLLHNDAATNSDGDPSLPPPPPSIATSVAAARPPIHVEEDKGRASKTTKASNTTTTSADDTTTPVPDDRASEITVRVAVRVRPLITREIVDSCVLCLETRGVVPDSRSASSSTLGAHEMTESAAAAAAACPTEIDIGNGRRFTFNHALPSDFGQEDVWEQCRVQNMVDGKEKKKILTKIYCLS